MKKQLEKNHLICPNCNFIFHSEGILKAVNPFDEKLRIYGCPKCKEVVEFLYKCDEPDCKNATACGFLTKEHGYRNACYKHSKL